MSLTPHGLWDLERTEILTCSFFLDLVDHYKRRYHERAVDCSTSFGIPHRNLADGSDCNFLFHNSSTAEASVTLVHCY